MFLGKKSVKIFILPGNYRDFLAGYESVINLQKILTMKTQRTFVR